MYNPQSFNDMIDNKIEQLKGMKMQPQQPIINQTIQTSPSVMKYANSLDEVNKELVIGDTPYFSKDMSVVWVKNIKGEVKTYELKEVVLKDEKDLMIESLQLQIKEMMENAKSTSNNDAESTQDEESTSISNGKPGNRKQR
jgi:hypothetical protein